MGIFAEIENMRPHVLSFSIFASEKDQKTPSVMETKRFFSFGDSGEG